LIGELMKVGTKGGYSLGLDKGLEIWRTSSEISSPAVPPPSSRASLVATESEMAWSGA
jgi:hypothetical protein